MTSTGKFLSTTLLSLLALSATIGFAQEAKIIKIVGKTEAATVTRNGQPKEASENMVLELNDVIDTGAGVEVYVQPYAGVVATIKANTHATVSKLAADDAELDLSKGGNIVAQIEPGKGHKFGVRTPKGVAAAKGTVYTVNVSGVNYTVMTTNGTVQVFQTPLPGQPVGQTVTIGAGSVSVSTVNGGASTSAASIQNNPEVAAVVNQAAAIAVSAVSRGRKYERQLRRRSVFDGQRRTHPDDGDRR